MRDAFSAMPDWAVRLLVGWALAELRLREVVLEADEGNTASIRVAEKCGFHRVGSRTEPGGHGVPRTVVVFGFGGPGPAPA